MNFSKKEERSCSRPTSLRLFPGPRALSSSYLPTPAFGLVLIFFLSSLSQFIRPQRQLFFHGVYRSTDVYILCWFPLLPRPHQPSVFNHRHSNQLFRCFTLPCTEPAAPRPMLKPDQEVLLRFVCRNCSSCGLKSKFIQSEYLLILRLCIRTRSHRHTSACCMENVLLVALFYTNPQNKYMNLQFSVSLFCSRCSASLHTMKSFSLWSLCANYPNKASCPEWKDFSSTEGNIEQNCVLIIVSTWDFCKLQTVFQTMLLTLRRRNRKYNISNFSPGEVHLQAIIANRLTVCFNKQTNDGESFF